MRRIMPFGLPTMKAFHGQLVVVVEVLREGAGTLAISAEGLPPAIVRLNFRHVPETDSADRRRGRTVGRDDPIAPLSLIRLTTTLSSRRHGVMPPYRIHVVLQLPQGKRNSTCQTFPSTPGQPWNKRGNVFRELGSAGSLAMKVFSPYCNFRTNMRQYKH